MPVAGNIVSALYHEL